MSMKMNEWLGLIQEENKEWLSAQHHHGDDDDKADEEEHHEYVWREKPEK